MTPLTRYNCEGHDANMVEQIDGDWIWAEKALAAMAELEADLAAAIAQVGQRERVIAAQSMDILRLTKRVNDLVEES